MSGIIAFCGSKYSGKSTSATLLKEVYGGQTEEIAFAGHLKNVCAKVFNIDMKYFLDPDLKEKEMDKYITLDENNIIAIFMEFDVLSWSYDKHIRPHIGQVFDTPRRLLQYVGTDLLHPIDKLIHIKKALTLKDPTKMSLITDLRFKSEFDELKKRGDVLVVYVSNEKARLAAASDSHSSEKDLASFAPKCDYEIDNNGTLEDLRSEVSRMLMKKGIQ